MRKVLHVLPWVVSGGVEQRRAQLVKLMSPAYEHRVCTMKMSDHWKSFYADHGVHVEVFGESWSIHDWKGIADLIAIIEDWQPDIVHGAVFEGMFMAALCGHMASAPRVIIEETGAPKQRSIEADTMIALLSAMSSRCVAVSNFAEAFLRERSMLRPPKLCKIVNGTRFPDIPDVSPRSQWGYTPADFVVGSIGRVTNEPKRFSDLIDALQWCPEHVKVLLVGDGPDLAMLKARAVEKGLADRVLFAGYQSEVGPFLKMMDCFVLPSRTESFGLALVEAMSAGLPCIGTNVCEMPSMLGPQGLLVDVEAPEQIARHINQLVCEPKEAKAYGDFLRARAYESFSAERYVRDVEALYDELCSTIG